MKREHVSQASKPFCPDCGENHDRPAHRGGFFRDGRFNPESDFDSPFEKFLEGLAMRRRVDKLSPKDIGEVILTSLFRDAFTLQILDYWLGESEWDMWATVPTLRGCEEYIKRAGYSSHVDCVWRDGFWIPRRLAKPEPMITAEQAAELTAILEQNYGPGILQKGDA